MPLYPGDKLGLYEILAPIGKGGMGEVYRAKDSTLGRQVAIKVLPRQLSADASARERVRREAAAAAALDHPFICKVFEIAEANGELFFVMELISGDTLYQHLRNGLFAQTEALRLAGEIAEALEEAHHKHFVHRDLKPANVMLTQGHVKVMDFGLAKRVEHTQPTDPSAATQTREAPLTALGTTVGTPDYMSPEQISGLPLDQRSDIFSFAILLCELLGHPHPFRRASSSETMAAILRDPPNLSGDLPQGLMLLIRRLLAKEPAERYATMAAVRTDLANLNTSTPPAGPEQLRLIGRENELAELKRALDQALAGRGSLIMIGGEPGIGKTHLTTALLEAGKQRGAFAVRGHCYEMEGAPPYIPFIEMLEYSANTAPREAFRHSLGEDAPEVAKLMPELRTMFPDMPAAIQLPPEQQRRFFFNAYRSFVARSAKLTPIVAVFEDLHWADESTLLLLQHVAQTLTTTPMLFIGTYRDVELETTRPFAKTLETLLRQKQATRISLRRLAVTGVEEMLAALSGRQPPASLARVVFEETEGNPFFVEEVFRHLAEEGKLFDETGKFRPGLRVDQLQVPEGVRLVLGRRLDRLGADARRVLTAAAIIGRSFSLTLLEELENKQPDAVLDAIEEAERAHLVNSDPAAGRDSRYRFVHELVRQTLAETLSLPRRQRLHARIAAAIETVHAKNLDSHAATLALHLYQAGAAVDPEKTTHYLTIAAQHATAGAAHEEALGHIENALSLHEDEQTLRVAELTDQKASVLRSLGRNAEAAEVYGMAISRLQRAGAFERAAESSIALAVLQAWSLEFDAAVLTINRALASYGGTQSPLRASLENFRAFALSVSGDVAAAASLLQAEDTDPNSPFDVADGIARMYAHVFSLQFKGAVLWASRVSDACRASGDLWRAAEAECFLGYTLFYGAKPSGEIDLADTIRLADSTGNLSALFVCKYCQGMIRLAAGDLAGAASAAEHLWYFGEANHFAWNFIADSFRSIVATLQGDFPQAERWALLRPEPRSHLHGTLSSQVFAVWAESNDPRAANAWINRTWTLPRPGQASPAGAWAALERSAIGLAFLGNTQDLAALRPLTEALVETGNWVAYNLHPFRTAAALAAAAAGDWSAAEHHHQTAIHQADTAPYKVSQPIAREWYATSLLQRGETESAKALLTEALALYESMKMPFHANRASGTLSRINGGG